MYISKKLLWLKEYIDDLHHTLPELKKLKRLIAKEPNKNMTHNQNCHGIITKYYNGKDTRIVLYTKYLLMTLKQEKVELQIKPYSKIDTLCFLAHELAHLRHWDHTPDHKSLEVIISQVFMNKLKVNGYISEEDEKSYYEPCRK